MAENRDGIEEDIKLDPELANPLRFLIATYLYLFGPKTVSELVKALGVTYGNLDSNLKRLREKGYVEVRKVLTLRGPRTLVDLTEKGIVEYRRLVERLKRILELVEGHEKRVAHTF